MLRVAGSNPAGLTIFSSMSNLTITLPNQNAPYDLELNSFQPAEDFPYLQRSARLLLHTHRRLPGQK